MENKIEYVIESIWILELKSGVCLFEEVYKDLTKDDIDSNLMLSFLSALLSFAGEVFTDKIKHIALSNHRIFFDFSKYILTVVAINDEIQINEMQIRKFIYILTEKFNNKFQTVFDLERWNGDIDQFNEFSEELRKIMKKDPYNVKIIQSLDPNQRYKKIDEQLERLTNKYIKHKEKLEKIYQKKIKNQRRVIDT